jgi:hypothetical protein
VGAQSAAAATLSFSLGFIFSVVLTLTPAIVVGTAESSALSDGSWEFHTHTRSEADLDRQ